MSSMTLCLFSVALCNIGGVDQQLFNQQPQQQNQQQGGFGQQIYNGFANAAGLGQFNQNQNGNGNGNGNRNKQKQPHPSPCKMKFQYATDGREWKGIIKLKNIDLSHDTLIEADFALPFQRNVSTNRNKLLLLPFFCIHARITNKFLLPYILE